MAEITAAKVETEVAIIDGRTISKGDMLIYFCLSIIMFMGKSCIEEIFIIINIHIDLVAVPIDLFSLFISFIAISPAGVAAQPNPIKLAVMFMHMYRKALEFTGMSGKRKDIIGLIFLDISSVNPLFSAMLSIPLQNDIVPAINMQSSTAEEAPFVMLSAAERVSPLKKHISIPNIITKLHIKSSKCPSPKFITEYYISGIWFVVR